VYIPEIDAEHQHFIRLVNELNEAIIGRMNKKMIKSRMRAILNDAAMHFAHEEAVFKEWGYPGAEEHAQIISFLNEIMESVDHGKMAHGWLEAGLEMKQVLIQHILNEDMKYRDYHVTQGQPSRPIP
jgi:hemerythrin